MLNKCMVQYCIKILAVIWLILLSTFALADERYLAFTEQKSVSLDGKWYFQPQDLSVNNDYKNLKQVALPSSFQTLTGNVNDHGTFIQEFQIPEQAVGKILALSMPYQYGAYEVYLNDILFLSAGKVGESEQHQTRMEPKIRTFVLTKPTFKLTIVSSSYQHIRGGLENSIFIGYDEQIREQFYRKVIMTTWISGMLIMIALFMALFSIYRNLHGQKNYQLFFLAVFILCFSLRSFFAVPFLYTLFTPLSWVWGTRIEYLLTQCICLFFMAYLSSAFPYLLNRYLSFILCSVIVVNILVTLTQQPIIFQNFFFKSFTLSIFLFANMLYGVYRIFKENISFSKINAIAIIIVSMTFIHDYLLGLNIIDSVEIAFYTSCLYFIVVTLNLSRDYAIQSEQSIQYNQQLIRLNQTLDQQVLERTQYIDQLNQQLSLQLKIDALTGTFNRYALNQEVQQRFDQMTHEHKALAFFMIDVDYFKNYNDHYGHLKGDDVLRTLVEILQEILPETAFLARYGGEEFAIVANDMNFDSAQVFAQQCLEAVRKYNLQHDYRLDHKTYITVSIGGAVMDCDRHYRYIVEMMKMADQQLYKAKEQRDCAVIG